MGVSEPRTLTATAAVATHGLTKRYGASAALAGVDLHIPDGAVSLLVGMNGAGKSTLFRVLMNLVRPDAGRAEVFGLDNAERGGEVRAQIGYVPGEPASGYGWMTCGGLLRHAAAYYPAWDEAYAQRLRGTFGLATARRVSTLSRGELRRLQLTLALSHRPRLLLLDEPTDGLDPVVRRRTLALLAEHLADSPATVLLATHQIHEVESLADHLCVLSGGVLEAQLSRDEARRSVRRYRVAVPEGWHVPDGLRAAGVRRSSGGREVQGTFIGEEQEVVARLAATGARVHETTALGLEAAALAFLPEEAS